ncbi:MAG: biotin/lipoyl-containing protein [Rhodothermia bacterium]
MNEDNFRVEVDGRIFEIDTSKGSISVDGRPVDVSVTHVSGYTYSILLNGQSHEFTAVSNGSQLTISGIAGTQDVSVFDRIALLLKESESAPSSRLAAAVRAPMPGLVLKIGIVEGQSIQPGTGLLVLEAMKMENEIFSSGDAVVKEIHVREGEAVNKGQLLVTLA